MGIELGLLDEIQVDNFMSSEHTRKGFVLKNHGDGFADIFSISAMGSCSVLPNMKTTSLRTLSSLPVKYSPWILECIRRILKAENEFVQYLLPCKKKIPSSIGSRMNEIVSLINRGLNHTVFGNFVRTARDLHDLAFSLISFKKTGTEHISELSELRNRVRELNIKNENTTKEKDVLLSSLSVNTAERQDVSSDFLVLKQNYFLLEKEKAIAVAEADKLMLFSMEQRNLVQRLEKNLRELEQNYSRALQNSHKINMDNDRTIRELDQARSEVKTLQKQTKTLKAQISDLTSKNARLETEMQMLKLAETRLKTRTFSLKNEVKLLSSELKIKNESLAVLRDEIALKDHEIKEKTTYAEKLHQKVGNLTEGILKCNFKRKKAEADAEECNAKMEVMSKELQDLREKHQQLAEKKRMESAMYHKLLDDFNREKDRNKRKFEEMHDENANLTKKNKKVLEYALETRKELSQREKEQQGILDSHKTLINLHTGFQEKNMHLQKLLKESKSHKEKVMDEVRALRRNLEVDFETIYENFQNKISIIAPAE